MKKKVVDTAVETPVVEVPKTPGFEIARDAFARAFAEVSKAVPGKTTLPVLRNVLLKGDHERGLVDLTATNLELTLKSRLANVAVGADFVTTSPAVTMNAVLGNWGSPNIQVGYNPRTVTLSINGGAGKANVKGISAEEFPTTYMQMDGNFGEGISFEIPYNLLDQIVKRVAVAARKDDARPVLAGVHIHRIGENLIAEAANGYTLSRAVFAAPNGMEGVDVIVPMPFIKLAASLHNSGNMVILQEVLKEGQPPTPLKISFRTISDEVTAPLISGNYPKIDHVIPDKTKVEVTVSASTLRTALKRAGIMNGELKLVTFTVNVGGQEIRLNSVDEDLGSHEESIPCSVTGESIVFAANGGYFTNAIDAVNGQDVVIGINTPSSPIVVTAQGEPGHTFVVMPMKIENTAPPIRNANATPVEPVAAPEPVVEEEVTVLDGSSEPASEPVEDPA